MRLSSILPYGQPPKALPPPSSSAPTDVHTNALNAHTDALDAHTDASAVRGRGAPAVAKKGNEQDVARNTLLVPVHAAWFR